MRPLVGGRVGLPFFSCRGLFSPFSFSAPGVSCLSSSLSGALSLRSSPSLLFPPPSRGLARASEVRGVGVGGGWSWLVWPGLGR